MKEKAKGHKVASAVAAVTVAAAILLTGTFAWQSISQEALNEKLETVNPGGRLHDDFDGTNKDVYVENFGDTPIFARVRLDEYMEIGAGAGLKTGDAEYGNKEATPVKVGTNINDMDTWVTHIPGDTEENDPFHQYIEWELGGQTTYMPTFNKNKDSLKADINGTYEGLTPDDDTHYDDYHAYSLGEQKTDDAVYDNDDNTTDEGDSALDPDNITKKNETHTAASTLTATVMTMEEWIAAGSQPGPYWVYDTDGWAYWAQAIEPDTATGLLLNELTQLSVPDDDWYYGINVVGQFASMGDWGTAEGNDGFFGDDAGAEPTDNAVFLLNQAAGYKLKVTVSAADNATTVKLGESLQMSAEVTIGGKKHANQDVTWSVGGNQDGNTNISDSGLLTIGADEYIGGTLTVQALSAADGTTIGTYTVTVESPWDTSGVGNITPGSMETANIDGKDWYVLARDGNKALIWATEMTFAGAFDDADNVWETSDIRTWLNDTYYNTSISTLKDHVVETSINTRKEFNSDEWITTQDKVFLLSEADLFGTFNYKATSEARDYTYGTSPLVPNVNMRRCSTTGPNYYLLRSPRSNDYSVAAGSAPYGTAFSGTYGYPDNGIRPAMWINLAQ